MTENLQVKIKIDTSEVQTGTGKVKKSFSSIRAEADKITAATKKTTASVKELTKNKKLKIDTSQAVSSVERVKSKLKDIDTLTDKNRTIKTNIVGDSAGAIGETTTQVEELTSALDQLRNISFADLLINSFRAIAASTSDLKKNVASLGSSIADAFSNVGFYATEEFKEDFGSGFKETLWAVQHDAKIYGARIKKSLGEVGNSAKNVGNTIAKSLTGASLKVVAAAATIIAAVAAIIVSFNNAINTAKRLKTEMSAAMAINMDLNSYQQWGYILDSVGIGADKLTDFLKTLADEQNAVRDGSEDVIAAFGKLGMTQEEVAGMGQQELFERTVAGLQNVENEVERTSIAYRIFGEDAAYLNNVLSVNAQEMAELRTQYELLGGNVSDSLIQKSGSLNSALSSLRIAWTGLTNTLAEAVMPAITKIINWITQAIAVINMFFRVLFGFSAVSKNTSSATDAATSSMNKYGASVDKATGAINKMKRTTQGFDELNIVNNPNTSSNDSPVGGGTGVQIPEITIPEIDAESLGLGKLEEISNWFDENAEKIRGWTTALAAAYLGLKAFKLLAGEGFSIGWLTTFISLLKEGNGFWATMAAAFPKVATVVTGLGKGFAALGGAIKGALAAIGGLVGGGVAAGLAIVLAVIAAIVGVVLYLKNNWEQLTNVAKKFFEESIAPKLEGIKNAFARLMEALGPVGDWLVIAVQWIKNVIVAIGEWLASIDWLNAIGAVFEFIGGVIVHVLGAVIGGAFSALMGVILGFVDFITGVVEIVSGFVRLIVALFSGDLQGAYDAVMMIGQGILDVFIGLYEATIGVVVNFVKGIIDWFVALWDELVGHSIVPDMVKAIIDWFLQLPKTLITMIANFVKDIIDWFIELATKAGKWAGEMWSKVKKPFEGVASWFKNIFQQAWNGITGIWNNVGSFFTGVWNKIKDIFSKVGSSIASGVTGAVKGAINSVLSSVVNKINTFIGWINGAVDLINAIPGVSIGKISKLSVPQLATGGIATRSTLANIGEAGREAVLPLDRNTGWMDQLADRIASRNSTPSRIVLMVDGRELGYATIDNINAITKQTGGLKLHIV